MGWDKLQGSYQPVPIIYDMDMGMEAARQAQDLQQILDEAEHKQRRLAKIQAWSNPEAIKQRYEEFEKAAKEALERGKRMAALAKEMIAENIPTSDEFQTQKPKRRTTFRVKDGK